MMPGAHLAPGTDLAPGIVVAECPPDIKLPMGVELVRRQQWAECPPGEERCTALSLHKMTEQYFVSRN